MLHRFGLGAMPMAFTDPDINDITHMDLALLISVATMPSPRSPSTAGG